LKKIYFFDSDVLTSGVNSNTTESEAASAEFNAPNLEFLMETSMIRFSLRLFCTHFVLFWKG